jgi:hypothetical protein
MLKNCKTLASTKRIVRKQSNLDDNLLSVLCNLLSVKNFLSFYEIETNLYGGIRISQSQSNCQKSLIHLSFKKLTITFLIFRNQRQTKK